MRVFSALRPPHNPIRITLFTFFLFVCFFYLCLHIFWPCYITSLIVFSLFISLLCVNAVFSSSSPIYDYIPTWYHEFIYNMQYFLSFCLYRFLIIIFFIFFPFAFPRFSVLFYPQEIFSLFFCLNNKSRNTLSSRTGRFFSFYTAVYPREFTPTRFSSTFLGKHTQQL